ncbi:Xyloside xylosyltransferase 1 [Armadillidium vulgare]|nr:Xyloside xylosyltransferase 1 [Armadillidium vulgare]
MAYRNKYIREIICLVIVTLVILKLISSIKYDKLQATNQVHTRSDVTVEVGSIKNEDADLEQDLQAREDALSLSPDENELLYRAPIDVALIFTNADKNNVIQHHLRRAVTTLLKNAHAPIRLHIISEEDSFEIGSKIIKNIQVQNQWDARHMKLVYVSALELAEEVGPIVKVLQEYFTSKSYSKYKDFLFFFSLFLDRMLPGLENIILMDIDIVVKGDIAELYSHFSRFNDSQVIGLSHELSPVYRHILSAYRSKHPGTKHGSAASLGGFPGFNSGVLLINIPKLRKSTIIKSYFSRKLLDTKTFEYIYRSHLGDQDLYTLIALDHPEVFYTLPCTWNRQLCKWWNNTLYHDVFNEYFKCEGDVKILHGNCQSNIPEDNKALWR